MCREVTMQISGLLIPTKHRHIPEPPKSYGSNFNADMLFIKDNGTMFLVEYKLTDLKGLVGQIHSVNEPIIGIINRRRIPDNSAYGCIFPFTGLDNEIDRLNAFLNHRHPFGKHYTRSGLFTTYWWGYKNYDSSLEGGFKNGTRLSFHELYKKAIENLQEEYRWSLDEYLVYSVLGNYEFETMKKYFRQVMKEKEKSTKTV